MQAKRREESGSEFLSYEQQRVVAISVALRTRDSFKVWSLGEPDAPEAELIQRFFDGIEKYTPDLVSWNGGGFDLPVLHYRALRHGIVAPRYWEARRRGPGVPLQQLSQPLSLAAPGSDGRVVELPGRARVSLQAAAVLLGLPGKLGMSGDKVWDAYLDGQIEAIRNYCETDVINTYLIYLRFELMRGRLLPDEYRSEIARVRDMLAQQAKPHFQEFLGAWPEPHG